MNQEIVREMPRPVISEEDYGQVLSYLQRSARGISSQALEAEIDRAEVLESKHLPSGSVRVNSRVSFRDLTSGQAREITIVRPEAADLDKGLVSFFAPVGAALLGLSAGQKIDWVMPNGKMRSFEVLSVKNEHRNAATASAA